ncbi:MAG: hypothetical protein IKC05_05425, partial [Lentisphaeria bacterium]|nr:hypothetical protein [Lentisphaeria bacterium]
FKRSAKPLKKEPPVRNMPQTLWTKAGQLIPLPLNNLEIRAAQTAHDTLRFGVRITRKRSNDAGFRIHLNFADGTDMKYFTSFCNGRFPADLAKEGDTFFFAVRFPAGRQITGCRVNVVELKSAVAPQ